MQIVDNRVPFMQDTPNQQEPTYAKFVELLCKPGIDILVHMDPRDAHLTHMAMGVAGEAGELLDAVKKSVIYRKPLDRENVLEECGDILFFVQGILNHYSNTEDDPVTIQEVIRMNRLKLSRRYYKGTYSNEQAQERADKA
jgi:NTP pyrophosphatase (non-canonical NTP hydrolase)